MVRHQKTAVVPTQLWQRRPNGRLQCDVCPRACQLDDGQKGFCYIRERRGDQIVLTAYGKSSGMAIDPIEKKPLYHFLPGSQVLSFGTIGCNLNCQFCQNWNISKSRNNHDLPITAWPDDIAATAVARGIPSVAFTYNEPIVFLEYAVDVALACHARGVKSVAVTNGYIAGKARELFFKNIDAANVDLKAFTEEFYHKVCGGHLADVLETLVYIKAHTQTWLEITTLLVPGDNDSPREIDEMTTWIFKNMGPDVPLHFSAFHPDWKMTDKPPTPVSTVTRARDIALKNGLHYVYTGNVRDDEGSHTRCVRCKASLIERRGFQVISNQLKKGGTCPSCATPVAGIFS